MNKQIEQIKEELSEHNDNFSQVARALGLDYHALTQRFRTPATPLPVPSGPEPKDIRSLGRRGFQQFVIAVKPCGWAWPEKYNKALADARRRFDAGTHEMFQTNDNGWVIQYLIPYLIPISPRRFFSTMEPVTNG